MNTTIAKRLNDLREVMRRERLAAFIFPSTDPHNSEYTPEYWKGREWITGFNGSAGVAVVTLQHAALWTDSRYFIAASQQLQGTEYELMRMGMPETPTVADWLEAELADSSWKEIGINGLVHTKTDAEQLIGEMRRRGGITVRTNFDPLHVIWKDRPQLPKDPIVIQPQVYAGERTSSKIDRIRHALRHQHADGTIVSALDDVAWTLNLRGTDVHCNPVFVAYLVITSTQAVLFTDMDKVSEEVKQYLEGEGVGVMPYENVMEKTNQLVDYNILLDPDQLNVRLFDAIHAQEIVVGRSPIAAMKAVKNEAEINGFRAAMRRDGVAMVKFLHWLKPAVAAGGQTEITLHEKLTALRAEQDLYKGISFDTIVGYGAHGAIVHYEATEATDATIEPKGMVLIDSGAQYMDGTTDITRTIALGELTDEERLVYTLVLKGHIQLELCKFPSGACGSQLDALARQAMWREGMNFMHGTGHGVGSYLNVHEGPHQIRMEWRPAPLLSGMTVTDEPGIYVEGKFGVRIENVLLVKPYQTTAFGTFLQFESLTLAPIDTVPVLTDMLLPEERVWLNLYHQEVYRELSPYLTAEENEWLLEATRVI